MAKEPPSKRYGAPSGRFWANVVVIALAHVALITGLIRWSVAAKASSNSESIVWLGNAGDISADETEKEESASPKQPPRERESNRLEQNETADEKPVVRTAKSEIELPSTTPRPTPTATPAKPSPTPASREKPTPKPVTKLKPSPAKANAKPEKKEKIVLAKKDSAAQSGSAPSGSTDKTGSVGGSNASEFGWYGNMLHDRFYSAWIQPTTNVPSGTKISTLVRVRIEKDGRVSKFEIAKPSGNATVNESVAAVAKQINQVDPPPTGLIKDDHYDVKINFELNTKEH